MIEPSKPSPDGSQSFKGGAVCLKISKEPRIVANDAIAQMEYKFNESYMVRHTQCQLRSPSKRRLSLHICVSTDDPGYHPAGCAGGV